jgi:hypothetical protein
MKIVRYNGWKNNIRLANRDIEVIITQDIGPRIMHCGFIGERNLFAELPDQQGGTGEKQWMLRGGHRLWIAPEDPRRTYELDNEPVEVKAIPGGVRVTQRKGRLTGIQKSMEITLSRDRNEVKVAHFLKNAGRRTSLVAPWALSVMARDGMAIIPLPAKIPHTKRLTHNQQWSLWGYTDLTDPRWTLGSRYVFFRQDRTRGPNKIGMAHREGWVAYQLGEFLFVKRFAWKEGGVYPDGDVNFEAFSNQDFLEVETLGPLVTLTPGKVIRHDETWALYRKIRPCRIEADVDRAILPLFLKG